MAVIPSSYAQVNLIFGGVALPLTAQCAYGVGPGMSGVTATAIAELHRDLWVAHLRGQTPDAVTLTTVRVKKGPNDVGEMAELAVGLGGSVASNPDTPAAAILIQKNSGFGGRRNRGRMFYPGVIEARTLSGGTIVSVDLANLETAFDAWIVQMTLANNPMAILHNDKRDEEGNIIEIAPPPTPVTGLNVQARLATQRRRLRR